MVDDEEAPVPSPVVIYKSVTDPTANAQIDALNKQVEMLTKQLDDLTKNQQLQSGTAQQAYGGDNAKDISEIVRHISLWFDLIDRKLRMQG